MSRPAFVGGIGPQRHPHQQRDQHAEKSQFKGGREFVGDGVNDPLLENHGIPQIQTTDLPQIAAILDDQRFVQSQFLFFLFDDFIRRMASQH